MNTFFLTNEMKVDLVQACVRGQGYRDLPEDVAIVIARRASTPLNIERLVTRLMVWTRLTGKPLTPAAAAEMPDRLMVGRERAQQAAQPPNVTA